MIHLATDARKFAIANCRLPINLKGFTAFQIGNRQSAMFLAGLTRLELAISASTVQRFTPTKLQPQGYEVRRKDLFTHVRFGFCRFCFGNFQDH